MTKFNKKVQKQILSIFKKETKDARKIGEKLGIPRHHVMHFLEESSLRTYSRKSYT